MTVRRLLRRALELPPHVAAQKAVRLGLRHWYRHFDRARDLRVTTYSFADPSPVPLERYFDSSSRSLLRDRQSELAKICAHYLDHRFDLLGSTWKSWCHSARDAGEPRVNPANRRESERRARLIRRSDYAPIDWQLDAKSGTRWSERIWFEDLEIFHSVPGSDVKVPWELGRMQHLVWLAATYHVARIADLGVDLQPERIAQEFANQVADFMAFNPPRYGVQWVCAMDVGLRAVSWLVAFDLFRASGARFDANPEWTSCFVASLRDHGRFIVRNLEWDPEVRGNHYLADVCALVYLGAYLPVDPETELWLRFGTQELLAETHLQFHADGANFEASTSYHRFAAEMVAHTTGLLLALPVERRDILRRSLPRNRKRVGPVALRCEALWPLPPSHFDRLESIAAFSRAVSVAGTSPLIGDDDSGTFIRGLPTWRSGVGSSGGTFEPAGHDAVCELIDAIVVRAAEPDAFASPWRVPAPWFASEVRREATARPAPVHRAFPDGGFFVVRSPEFHLVFRAGPNGQKGNGGHAHNDQLSFTLSLSGMPLLIDSGTYVYSSFPDERNRFRSTAMHSTLVFNGMEQNAWEPGVGGLFRLADRARGCVTRFADDVIEAEHSGYGVVHRRTLRFETSAIAGTDTVGRPGNLQVHFVLAPGVRVDEESRTRLRFEVGGITADLECNDAEAVVEESTSSPAYGVLAPNRHVTLRRFGAEVRWRLEWVGP